MNQLEPCPHCERHVKISETACPFCAGALDFAHVAPRAMPGAFLGRAAVFAFGIAASACGDSDPKPPTHDAATVPKDSSLDASPFDAFVDPDAGGTTIYASAPVDGGFLDNANIGRGKS